MLLFLVNPKEIIYRAGHFLGTYPVKMAVFRCNSWLYITCISSENFESKIK